MNSSGGATFGTKVTFTNDIIVPGSRGTYASGLSGNLKFSNGAHLIFSKGILTGVTPPTDGWSADGMNWTT